MTGSRIEHPPHKILFATDLTARCDRALARVAVLAETWSASVIAVHALEKPNDDVCHGFEPPEPTWRRLSDSLLDIREKMRRDVTRATGNAAIIAERGKPVEVISSVARTQQCGLVVTGISRDETLTRLGMRRTIDRLATRSRLPQLAVKETVSGPYRNILVGVDFTDAARRALQTVTAFFPTQSCSILHAYEPALSGVTGDSVRRGEDYRKIALKDCATFLAASGIPEETRRAFKLVVEHGKPANLIQQYVRDRDVDLVVLGTHGGNALLDLFFGSTSKELLTSLPSDILIVPSPTETEQEAGPRSSAFVRT